MRMLAEEAKGKSDKGLVGRDPAPFGGMKLPIATLILVLAGGCATAPAPPASEPRTATPESTHGTMTTDTAGTTSAAPAPAARMADAPRPAKNVLPDLPHPRVDYWVERFSRGDKRPEIEAAFARKPQLEAMLTEKLRARGMPEELIYLAMAESGFNAEAHSAAAARGIWQLIPATARQYGLRVDEPGSASAGELVDERRDPAKSTDAALAYLTYLYNRFGSWYLAGAAYNAGQGRVARIMTEVTGAEKGADDDYYRIWDSLPGETRDYIPATIALMRLGKEPARYGFAPAP